METGDGITAMIVDRSTSILFDASCLIAASGSPTGGSSLLLDLCARALLHGIVTHVILLEAERNIEAKLGPKALTRYHALLKSIAFRNAPIPELVDDHPIRRAVTAKDVHVVAAATAIGAAYLVTLDRGLIDQVNGADLGVHALTPGDFITQVLPHHKDYPGDIR